MWHRINIMRLVALAFEKLFRWVACLSQLSICSKFFWYSFKHSRASSIFSLIAQMQNPASLTFIASLSKVATSNSLCKPSCYLVWAKKMPSILLFVAANHLFSFFLLFIWYIKDFICLLIFAKNVISSSVFLYFIIFQDYLGQSVWVWNALSHIS